MLEKIVRNGTLCAAVTGGEVVIRDAQSALDLLMCAAYEAGTKNIVISRSQIAEEFFHLSTGLAGEKKKKYINYGGRIAIYGNDLHSASEPLKDFIYESNKGKSVFFVSTREEAVDMLTRE